MSNRGTAAAFLWLPLVFACSESQEPMRVGETQGSMTFVDETCIDPANCAGTTPGVEVPTSPTLPSISLDVAPPVVGPEVSCNGVDEDGDGSDLCLGDADGDGARFEEDCDDLNPAYGPHAHEIRCDGRDQNCDGFDDCDTDRDGVLDADDCAANDPSIGLQCRWTATPPPTLN